MTDWKQQLRARLTTPEEAVSVVKDGDRVVIGMMHLTPLALCRALAARYRELTGVIIDASLSTFTNWWSDGFSPLHASAIAEPWGEVGQGTEGFALESFFLLEQDRSLYGRGLLEYRIAPPFRQDESRWTTRPIDPFMTQVTPPDAGGN